MSVHARYISKPILDGQHQFEIACNANDSRKRNSFNQQNMLQHDMEIDALIRHHNANLRSGLEEIQNRNHKKLLQILQNEAEKKLAEKDFEIQKLKARQTELEAGLKQLTSENQIWFNVAKNSEHVISNLKNSLNEALKQNAGEGHVSNGHAEDMVSCCYEGDSDDRKVDRLCKRCNERDVSVVVIPCRHLCLCVGCERLTDTCPICSVEKNVSLQVFYAGE